MSDARRWRLLARLPLLIALLLFLALGNAPERTRLWDALFDAGHVPLFGIIALILRSLLAGASTDDVPPGRSALAFGATLLIGAATEFLQLLQANRDASLGDFLRDAAGAGAFLLVREVWDSAHRPTGRLRTTARRLAALAAALVLIGAAATELMATGALYVSRARAMPTLFALDGSWWERRLIATGDNLLTPAARGVVGGAAASGMAGFARLDLRPGVYSGLTFDEPYPDWRSYHYLVLTVVSDLDAPLPLILRVHDAEHDQRYEDRFNRQLVVQPGLNRFAVSIDDIRRAPDRREMDMRRVRGIILFAYRLERQTHLYFGPIRLE